MSVYNRLLNITTPESSLDGLNFINCIAGNDIAFRIINKTTPRKCNCSRRPLSRSSEAREGAALEGQADGVEGSDGSSSRGFDDRSNVGIELRAPLASKAVGSLSIDRAGAQGALGAVVGRLDFAVGQEDEQVRADLFDDVLDFAAGRSGRGQRVDPAPARLQHVDDAADDPSVVNARRAARVGGKMLPKDFPPWQTVYWWFRRHAIPSAWPQRQLVGNIEALRVNRAFGGFPEIS